jgi:hypothetical protein
MAKTTVVDLSDPAQGSDEAFGRMLNALFLPLTLQDKGADVALVFPGAGTRWPVESGRLGHPAHALCRSVRISVAGVCGGCADAFGATESLTTAGIALTCERAPPGIHRQGYRPVHCD